MNQASLTLVLDDSHHLLGHPAQAVEPELEPSDIPALTRALSRGDQAACREFHRLYFDRLYRYLIVVTRGNEDNAREALQAAFIRVARYAKPFPSESAFWSWLTVVARTSLADLSRKRTRYAAFIERFTIHSRLANAPARDPGQSDEKLNNSLDQNLASLPSGERDLIESRYFHHQSVRDIAHALNATEKSVESKLARIRRKLRDAILGDLSHE